MTREKTIERCIELAIDLHKNGFERSKYNEIFRIASDYNSEHYMDNEICICDLCKDDGYEFDGIAIEDEIFSFEY